MKEYILQLESYQWINPILLNDISKSFNVSCEIVGNTIVIKYHKTFDNKTTLKLGLALGSMITDKHVDQELG